jgi:hypothetical protein
MKKTDTGYDLARYREINKYTENFITEQAVPAPPPPAADPNVAPPLDDPNALPPAPGGEETLPPVDELPAEGEPEGEIDPMADVEGDPTTDDTTEEIDITDLVNMVKDVKKQMDEPQGDSPEELQKMDGIFSKLGELEGKLGEMDSVLAKIDQLGAQIEDAKPPTPVEKLEMRSLDSYPFNKKPDEFFSEKKDEMKKSGKNEYVLTKGDVENYGKYDMMKSFNPAVDDNY